ncbi:hypothetical protein BH10BAC6_BH10BAC6_11940 [soil metagenome]
MKRTLLVLALFIISNVAATSADDTTAVVQQVQQTALEISLSGGPQRTYFRDVTTPLTEQRQFWGWSATGKIMWHPDHILSVGVLTGYALFSTENFTKDDIPLLNEPFKLTLEAVPLQLALSMQSGGFEINVGLGGYFLSSTVTGGNAVRQANTIFEIGVSTQASYMLSLGDTFSIGPEINVQLMSNRGILAVTPSLRAKWEFVRY